MGFIESIDSRDAPCLSVSVSRNSSGLAGLLSSWTLAAPTELLQSCRATRGALRTAYPPPQIEKLHVPSLDQFKPLPLQTFGHQNSQIRGEVLFGSPIPSL